MKTLAMILLACTATAAQCQTVIYPYYPQQYITPVIVHPPVVAPEKVEEPKREEPAGDQPKKVPPAECKDGCKIETTEEDQDGPQVLNFGVQLGKLGGTPRYRLNGVEISRDQAIAAVEGADIPDDANLLRLTLIGSKEDRTRVLEDLDRHPALAHLKGKLLVQAYDPTDPRVAKRGFVTTGKPTIYLSAPDGKVITRNVDGEYPGPEALAYAIGAAAGKPYSPDNDQPLPKKPEPQPQPLAVPKSLSDVPQWAWIAGAVAVFFYLQNRNKGAGQ